MINSNFKMVTLFVSQFEKRYNSRLFSCSTFFVGILFLLTIIIPYILVYITDSKHNITSDLS